MPIVLDEPTYHSLRENYCGICVACFTVKHGDCEPDAENYHCENCEKEKVQGIENLLVMGVIDIKDEETKPHVTLKNRKTGIVSTKFLTF